MDLFSIVFYPSMPPLPPSPLPLPSFSLIEPRREHARPNPYVVSTRPYPLNLTETRPVKTHLFSTIELQPALLMHLCIFRRFSGLPWRILMVPPGSANEREWFQSLSGIGWNSRSINDYDSMGALYARQSILWHKRSEFCHNRSMLVESKLLK